MIEWYVRFILSDKRVNYVNLLGILIAIILFVGFCLLFLGAVDQNLDQYSGSH